MAGKTPAKSPQSVAPTNRQHSKDNSKWNKQKNNTDDNRNHPRRIPFTCELLRSTSLPFTSRNTSFPRKMHSNNRYFLWRSSNVRKFNFDAIFWHLHGTENNLCIATDVWIECLIISFYRSIANAKMWLTVLSNGRCIVQFIIANAQRRQWWKNAGESSQGVHLYWNFLSIYKTLYSKPPYNLKIDFTL